MSRNKFGFGPIDAPDTPKRKRNPGPMGTAVREAAGSLAESTENLVEQRRRNASDAKEWRRAQDEGRVLVELPVGEIRTDALPRDRLDLEAVAASDEMEELKTSMRERGQKEPIEVFQVDGGYQLKKGWRRLTALRQLHKETGDDRFARAVARVDEGQSSRIDLYIDMVEENVIREDLSFAEMAQVAIIAAQEEGQGARDLVSRIYASLHKMKRSYIRSFVHLLEELGEALKFPKAVPRNLGVDVVRRLQAAPDLAEALRGDLIGAETVEDQLAILRRFADGETRVAVAPKSQKSVKYEFHVGKSKVTARKGECRILSEVDFSSVDRAKLQRAVEAFEAALEQ